MKKIIMTWGFVFLAMILCGPAQAAIEWDPVLVDSDFLISSQGGSFYYPPVSNWSNSHVNRDNSDTLTEFDTAPHAVPGTATLYAQSSGGILPMGAQVQGYADITFSGAAGISNHFDAGENGMNVSQFVTSTIVRKFTNDGSTPMTVNLMAEFTGAINFNSFNYDYTTGTILNEDTYAYYLLSGNVTILEFSPIQGLQTHTVLLDNDTWSDSFEDIVIHPASEDYYYYLSTSLTIETHVKNWTYGPLGFESFPLDGPFFIGSDPNNPFTLTATVPVPPSLVLLISGLGGLALARRRFSKGRQQG